MKKQFFSTPAFQRLRQEDYHEFEASLDYRETLWTIYFKKKKKGSQGDSLVGELLIKRKDLNSDPRTHRAWMPVLPALGRKRWAHPLKLLSPALAELVNSNETQSQKTEGQQLRQMCMSSSGVHIHIHAHICAPTCKRIPRTHTCTCPHMHKWVSPSALHKNQEDEVFPFLVFMFSFYSKSMFKNIFRFWESWLTSEPNLFITMCFWSWSQTQDQISRMLKTLNSVLLPEQLIYVMVRLLCLYDVVPAQEPDSYVCYKQGLFPFKQK